MKKWWLSILILSAVHGVFAQQKPATGFKRQYWKSLWSISRSKKTSGTITYLQQMIDLAKKNGRYGWAIYYELLLGDQYEKMDDYGIAEGIFFTAYEEAKKYRPAKHTFSRDYLTTAAQQKTYFDPIDRLAYFYLSIGNLKNAEQLFQESKTLRNSFFPKYSIHRVHPEVGMGSYYFRKGQYDKTYVQFSKAQAMMARATTTGYDFDNLNRLFLNDLVELCLILGKQKEAFKYLNSLAIASSGFGKFGSTMFANMEIARVYELKSRCYLTSGDLKKAREYLDKANHYNPASAAASTVKLKLLRTEAILNWYQAKTDQSALAFQKMVETYREHIQENFAAMSDYEREQFYYTLKDDFDLFNAFVFENPAALKSLVGEVYNNILNTKALLLNETNRLKNQILRSGNQGLIEKLDRWEKNKDQLAALYFEKNTPEQIDSLEKSIENLEREINQSSGLFQKKEHGVTWQDVKATLKDGEAAIEILRVNTFNKNNPQKSVLRNGLTDSTVYMMLMVKSTSEQPEVFYQYDGNRLENHFLPYYRNSVLAKTEDKLSYENFWRAIKTHLTGIKKVYLSADGVYNQINLNTLRNLTSQNYLIDEIELVLLTNTGDLLAVKPGSQSNEAFLIGRPAFEFSSAQISSALSSPAISLSLANGTRSINSEELINFKEQAFADLPGTAEEVSQISAVLKSQDMKVTTYIGADALEENVKALKKPDVLHIATHGFFVQDTASSISPMIRSGIILAGVRNGESKSKEDGILTAYEATNLDLEGTSLVALSACQTGLGEVRNGEGVYGLQRSIMVAGAKNLLMSLWKVDDAATAKLMSIFYQLRRGKSNLEAFREAQIQLRNTYPEPFYWGAFVMLGK